MYYEHATQTENVFRNVEIEMDTRDGERGKAATKHISPIVNLSDLCV